MNEQIQQEVDRNYEVFCKLLPELLIHHRNKFAVMRKGEIRAYFSTAIDAILDIWPSMMNYFQFNMSLTML